MKLYYSPGACSMASHISLIEAGLKAETVKVDLRSKLDETGADFTKINPKGYVPALQLDNGRTMSEGVAILQYVADQAADRKLLPAWGTVERYKAIEWLNYIATEVHKSYSPLFRPGMTAEQKTAQYGVIEKRLQFIEPHLGPSGYILGPEFSVVDTYLFVILSWSAKVGMDLSAFPNVQAFVARMMKRPSVVSAMTAEGLLKN
jgi:glutathione S-transferase